MTKMLLVDLDKDYIRRMDLTLVERLKHDLFTEAVDNLQEDIKLWGADSGINLQLESVNEVEKEPGDLAAITRTHTRVYAVIENNDELAWITLSLGNIKPATSLIRSRNRGWQFEWKT
jgi:hypothetical protein